MKRISAVLGTAAVVLWAAGALAQGKPNFAGTWTLDQEKTAAANPEAGGGGRRGGAPAATLVIKQDAASLTIERQGGRGPAQTVVYKLDGSEVSVPGGRGGAGTAKATWEGNTIVIQTTRSMGENTFTTKDTYAVEGDWLVIATERPGRGGGAATTTKAYYKKGM